MLTNHNCGCPYFVTLIMLNVVRWLIFDSSQLFFIVWRKDQMLCWLFSCPIHLYDHFKSWWSFWSLFFIFGGRFGFFLLFCLFVWFFSTFLCVLFCFFPSALYSMALAVVLLCLIFYRNGCLYCVGRCYGFKYFFQFIVTQTFVFSVCFLSF